MPANNATVLRIDGYDQGGVEEQPNIGPEPSAAKIARTKHPAIRAGIVRPRVASRHGYEQETAAPTDTRTANRFKQRPASVTPPHNLFNCERSPGSGLARLFAGSQGDFRHPPAVQGHPGILGDGYLSV